MASKPIHIVALIRRLIQSPGKVAKAQVLGPCERATLAAGYALREALGGTLTVLSLGPANREDRVLAITLRGGCDRAIRLWDITF